MHTQKIKNIYSTCPSSRDANWDNTIFIGTTLNTFVFPLTRTHTLRHSQMVNPHLLSFFFVKCVLTPFINPNQLNPYVVIEYMCWRVYKMFFIEKNLFSKNGSRSPIPSAQHLDVDKVESVTF